MIELGVSMELRHIRLLIVWFWVRLDPAADRFRRLSNGVELPQPKAGGAATKQVIATAPESR
jgi:hypothetical protein